MPSEQGAPAFCTGPSAFWCPVCGDCTCERAHNGECCFDSEDCPLHGATSDHADTVELAQARDAVRRMITAFDCEVTEADQEELTRFAQLLFEKAESAR